VGWVSASSKWKNNKIRRFRMKMSQERGGGRLGFSVGANPPYADVAAPPSVNDLYEESLLLRTS
jgi:hypothetical protein